jgi:DNA-nicking Smr family endonuclease
LGHRSVCRPPSLELTLFIGLNVVMKRGDSIYYVLRDLPLAVKKIERPAETEHESGAATQIPGPVDVLDEDRVFEEAMKDVRRITHGKHRVPDPTPRGDHQRRYRKAHDPTMGDTLTDEYPIIVSNLPEYMEGYVDGLSPSIMDKLRNEEFSVRETLDLHGLSCTNAAEVFSVFLDRAIHNGVCCIKVIHGRGLKSKDGPVLKEKLKEWLVRALHRKWVVAFCSSKMAHGGPGATLILLRTRPTKKRLHIIG